MKNTKKIGLVWDRNQIYNIIKLPSAFCARLPTPQHHQPLERGVSYKSKKIEKNNYIIFHSS